METRTPFPRSTVLVYALAILGILFVILGGFVIDSLVQEMYNPMLGVGHLTWLDAPFLLMASFPLWLGLTLLSGVFQQQRLGLAMLGMATLSVLTGAALWSTFFT